jgi:lipopolysaccharide export system protein LptC
MFQRPWTKALAFGWAMACLLPACGSSQGTERTAVAPELKLERVRFRVWRGDALRARGDARQVTIRKDTSQVWAEDVRAELPSGSEPVLITAPAGRGNLAAGTFSAEGGVRVVHGGERATTERARYVPGPGGSDGQILGDDPVVVERGGNRLSGVGFTYDPRRGLLEVGGPVQTEAAGEGR